MHRTPRQYGEAMVNQAAKKGIAAGHCMRFFVVNKSPLGFETLRVAMAWFLSQLFSELFEDVLVW